MTNDMEGKERYLDVRELSEFLAVPESWVYARTSSGSIPCVKLGHYVRFWLPDVLHWLESYEREAAR